MTVATINREIGWARDQDRALRTATALTARGGWHHVLAAGVDSGLYAIERLMRRNSLKRV